MNATKRCLTVLLAIGTLAAMAASATADPLKGQVLKFQQKPMIKTPIKGVDYNGHDELSTAYLTPQAGTNLMEYTGVAMADDFADEFKTPVVHVRWWGSYPEFNPDQPVDKFLIAFESDLPADQNPLGFSRPDQVLSSQIVKRVAAGPLAAGSGTYFEKQLTFGLPEDIYEYNAELNLGQEFAQKPDTVYWLKVVALVDNQPLPGTQNTQWGWHNRDYTVPNPLASPAVLPGELNEQPLIDPGYPAEVWHFQDDSVSADTRIVIDPNDPTLTPNVVQTNYNPQRYIDKLDGPGPEFDAAGNLIHGGISQFSKDLAFELYTIPEPASVILIVLGVVGLWIGSRRKRLA